MDTDPRQYDSIVVNSNDIHNIVLSYLVHNCYKDTVGSFVACTGLKQPPNVMEEMEKRKAIFRCIMEGNPLKAIELTQQLAPDLLEKNKDLHFEVLCLNFIELIRSRKCVEALEYAQTKLGSFGQIHKKYLDQLQELLPLLAYEDPETSPVFHFLSMDHRQHIADHLNKAILENANLPCHSALERLTQQATIVRQCLNQEVGKTKSLSSSMVATLRIYLQLTDGAQPFSLKEFLKS